MELHFSMPYWKDKPIQYSKKFLNKYGSEDACILKIINIYYPDSFYCKKCREYTTFYPIERKTVFARKYKQWHCGCGFSFNPLAHTPFKATSIPFDQWLKGMYILCNYGNVSVRYMQSGLIITGYKSGWRMKHIIRKLFLDPRFFSLIDELTEQDPITAYQETRQLQRQQQVKNGKYGRDIQLGLIKKVLD